MDVAVVGNVGIDTNVYFGNGKINFEVESNFTTNRDYVGQAGGYSARGYAQLGHKTTFIGSVGNDHNGDFIRNVFDNDNIDMEGLFCDQSGTARSINFMNSDGTRKNFYDGKNHMEISPDLHLCEQILKNCGLAHFHIPNWARKLLPIAKRNEVKIGCDLQDIISLDDEYRKDFIDQSDILFFSAVNHADPRELVERLIAGGKIALVGLGAEGCLLGSDRGVQHFAALEIDRPVVDTNGAGDGLAVGFLSSYFLEGKSLEDSVCRAQLCARYTCSQKASTDGLISAQQLQDFFSKIN